MGNGFGSYATNGSACGEEGVDDDGAMGCATRFQDVRHTIPYIIAVGALGADGINLLIQLLIHPFGCQELVANTVITMI